MCSLFIWSILKVFFFLGLGTKIQPRRQAITFQMRTNRVWGYGKKGIFFHSFILLSIYFRSVWQTLQMKSVSLFLFPIQSPSTFWLNVSMWLRNTNVIYTVTITVLKSNLFFLLFSFQRHIIQIYFGHIKRNRKKNPNELNDYFRKSKSKKKKIWDEIPFIFSTVQTTSLFFFFSSFAFVCVLNYLSWILSHVHVLKSAKKG